MDKYELIKDDTVETNNGIILYRIKALRSFGTVTEGDLGGYIEKEENLCHSGNAWVFNKAWVCENARVCENATIADSAVVSGSAIVTGHAHVYGECDVTGTSCICDHAHVYGEALIEEYATVGGDARVYDNAHLHGRCSALDDVIICDCANVAGNSRLYDNSSVRGNARVTDIVAYDNATIYGEANIYNLTIVTGDGDIHGQNDYISLSPVTMNGNNGKCVVTVHKTKNGNAKCSMYNKALPTTRMSDEDILKLTCKELLDAAITYVSNN